MIRYLGCALLSWALAMMFLGSVSLVGAGDPPGKEDEPTLKKKPKQDAPVGPDQPAPKEKNDPAKQDEPVLKKKPKKEDKDKAEPLDPKDPKKLDPKGLPPTESPEEILKRIRENMEASEQRLKKQDPGADTRKIQRDIVRDLDDLINQEQNDPSGSGNSGGSKQKKRDRGQAKNQGNKGGKDPSKGAKTDPKVGQKSGSDKTPAGKGGKNGEAAKADSPADFGHGLWGEWPAHQRMELDAYSRDRFMRDYEQVLRQYYRTIAEQGGRRK